MLHRNIDVRLVAGAPPKSMTFRFLKVAKTAGSLIRAGELTKATDVVMRVLSGTPATRRAVPNPRPTGETIAPMQEAGRFVDGHLATDSNARYKLHIPAGEPTGAALIVMLHGCTQDPADFAAGTAMNQRADAQGFYVLYPEQPSSSNLSRCWNWYRPVDQQRDTGEPAIIATMTRSIIAQYDIDPKRVHVAGLSAGGAMAAIVASRYPDLFASVGVHSGLPVGSASNVPDALSLMRTGRSRQSPSANVDATTRFVPTIVFQGDRDSTVHPSNGPQVIAQALAQRHDDTTEIAEDGVSSGGKRYTRTTYRSPSGEPLAEYWLLHDVAHAWSGGDMRGTHTDVKGPSASDEMLRFFRSHPKT